MLRTRIGGGGGDIGYADACEEMRYVDVNHAEAMSSGPFDVVLQHISLPKKSQRMSNYKANALLTSQVLWRSSFLVRGSDTPITSGLLVVSVDQVMRFLLLENNVRVMEYDK